MRYLYILVFVLAQQITSAQVKKDSVIILETVQVQAFEKNVANLNIAASINTITNKQIQAFTPGSIVNTMNATAGVRMEERSPGSYRLNIRGSSLRSPFGVRNVKIYLNDMPLTEPSGVSYINQLDFNGISAIHIIKGPASSMYGAGNGGTLLIHTGSKNKQFVKGQFSIGSFNTKNMQVQAVVKNHLLIFNKFTSDGYRNHTKLERNNFQWQSNFINTEKTKLSTYMLGGDLFYQTPGGLTDVEYAANPLQARPKVGITPSAQQAQAAIKQKMLAASIKLEQQLHTQLKNKTVLYFNKTQVQNPTFRNYEHRTEPHQGGRSVFTWLPLANSKYLQTDFGVEYQKGSYTNKVFSNKSGNPDTLSTIDHLTPSQANAFFQLHIDAKKLQLNISNSFNTYKLNITRISKTNTKYWSYKNTQNNTLRLAALYKLKTNWNMYANLAKGFSPPTIAEFLPSNGVLNTILQAEKGNNLEIGTKYVLNNKLSVNLSAFQYNLNNTIVVRKDITGADYFVNSGSTIQKGIELDANYTLNTSKKYFNNTSIDASIAYHHFTYKDFIQNASNFSGKYLPGIPKLSTSIIINTSISKRLYYSLTSQYVEKIYLNDANAVSAPSYLLINSKLQLEAINTKKYGIDIFATADNILNKTYSLGNDINASANRYFNVAPRRNFTLGVIFMAK